MQKITLLLLFTLGPVIANAADNPKMAVASNMSHALKEIAAEFYRDTGISPKLSFGSSGNFARQIVQGAPFRIFLSADSSYIDFITKHKVRVISDIKYARGRIGLFVGNDSPLVKSTDLRSVIKNLFHGRYKRLVIANPEHAPYGRASKQALQSAGLWVIEKQRLLLAENAAQATQIAGSGNVDVGIIAASDALLPMIRERGKFFLIPEEWHQPLQQHLVLLDGATSTESQLFHYLQTSKARLIMEKYGYLVDAGIRQNMVYGLAGP